MINAKPLRLRPPRVVEERSEAVLAVAVNVAADLRGRGWTAERAEAFAARVVDNPLLWLTYSGCGARRTDLPRPVYSEPVDGAA